MPGPNRPGILHRGQIKALYGALWDYRFLAFSGSVEARDFRAGPDST